MSGRQLTRMANQRSAGTRQQTASATSGSMTTTSTQAGPSVLLNATQGTLRLRAVPEEPAEEKHIQWAEDVVDNEGMGKKSSKVCCIYHKPREAGESSSDSSSDSSSSDDDSGDERDLSRAQPARRPARHHDRHQQENGHTRVPADNEPGENAQCGSHNKGKGKARRASGNAYEKQPKQK